VARVQASGPPSRTVRSRRTGKVFAERMLYTMASPEFGRSGLRRRDEAAEVAEAVIRDVQAELEPGEFPQFGTPARHPWRHVPDRRC
jgi:hypothetical protein